MKSTRARVFTVAFVLLTVTVLIGWGISAAFADVENISVSVKYDVGVIIAAFLGGSGVASYGFGYANRYKE